MKSKRFALVMVDVFLKAKRWRRWGRRVTQGGRPDGGDAAGGEGEGRVVGRGNGKMRECGKLYARSHVA